eukprot:PhM_4_TR13978/c2_g1_i1/m.35995
MISVNFMTYLSAVLVVIGLVVSITPQFMSVPSVDVVPEQSLCDLLASCVVNATSLSGPAQSLVMWQTEAEKILPNLLVQTGDSGCPESRMCSTQVTFPTSTTTTSVQLCFDVPGLPQQVSAKHDSVAVPLAIIGLVVGLIGLSISLFALRVTNVALVELREDLMMLTCEEEMDVLSNDPTPCLTEATSVFEFRSLSLPLQDLRNARELRMGITTVDLPVLSRPSQSQVNTSPSVTNNNNMNRRDSVDRSGSMCDDVNKAVNLPDGIGNSSMRTRNSHRPFKATLLLLRAHRVRTTVPENMERWEAIMISVLDLCEQMNCEVIQFDLSQIMLCWNVNKSCPEHAIEACRSALKIQQTLLTQRITDYSISIASGEAICGFTGNRFTRFWMVLGDLREHLEQLQQLCEIINSRILVSQRVADYITGHENIALRVVDSVLFQSRFNPSDSDSQCVYEISRSTSSSTNVNRALFKHAFSAFCEGDYEVCEDLLTKYMEHNPKDHHANRLRSMVHKRDDLGIEPPYYRLFAGWERITTVEVSDSLSSIARPSSAQSFRFTRASAHAERLKEDIDRYMTAKSQPAVVANKPTSRGRGRAAAKSSASHVGSQSNGSEYSDEDVLQQDVDELIQGSSAASGEFDDFVEEDIDAPTDQLEPLLKDIDNRIWRCSVKPVGRGQTATVYIGMSEAGVLVALKVLKLSAETRDNLLCEVELLAKLRHPNILPYISCASSKGSVVVITQFVSGGSLETMLENFGAMPKSILKRFLRDVVRGIRYLHQQNFMHSDIKPANVLLDTDGVCKLSDFGTATHMDVGTGLRGTPLYMAPEQARGQPCAASDIWALGIMILLLATNEVPYPIGTSTEFYSFVFRIGKETLKPIIPEDLDNELKDFVAGCLKSNPHERYTADALHSHRFLM